MNTHANEFLTLLLGTISPAAFLYNFIAIVIGFSIRHYSTVKNAVNSTNGHPNKFQLGYWFATNYRALFLFVAISYSLIRSPQEIALFFGFNGLFEQFKASPILYLIVGIYYEYFLVIIRKKIWESKK